MTTTKNFTVYSTSKIDGGAYRWIKFADGSAGVEGWGPKGWTPGGATFGEFLETPPVSPRFAAELGIPLGDVTIEREKPTPPSDRTRFRAMADLAVKWAEEDALRMLAMKAKHVRELDRRRPDLIGNNTLH